MHIIAIDGGGTKTDAVLADREGNILKKETGGPSVWRNVGMEKSVKEVFSLIEKVKEEKEVSLFCITLAGIEEEEKGKKSAFVENLRREGIRGEILIESDQKAAFRAGTEEKDGVVVICGTGAVACGWRGPGVVRASGWGYLADEGGAFYTGIEGFRAVQKSFDKREKETKLKDMLCKEWEVSSPEEINRIIYSDFRKNVPFISSLVGMAGDRGDEVSKKILKKGAKEIALSAKTVINELGFTQEEFSLVTAGGMFNSERFTSFFEEEIAAFSPGARIAPSGEPVKGAVKLAIERIKSL